VRRDLDGENGKWRGEVGIQLGMCLYGLKWKRRMARVWNWDDNESPVMIQWKEGSERSAVAQIWIDALGKIYFSEDSECARGCYLNRTVIFEDLIAGSGYSARFWKQATPWISNYSGWVMHWSGSIWEGGRSSGLKFQWFMSPKYVFLKPLKLCCDFIPVE
jgi:hypothetical protein